MFLPCSKNPPSSGQPPLQIRGCPDTATTRTPPAHTPGPRRPHPPCIRFLYQPRPPCPHRPVPTGSFHATSAVSVSLPHRGGEGGGDRKLWGWAGGRCELGTWTGGMQRPGEREGGGRGYNLVRFVRCVHPQPSTQPRVHVPITPKSLGPLRSLPPAPLPSPFHPQAPTGWLWLLYIRLRFPGSYTNGI